MRSGAVRSADRFQLQEAEIDSQLNDLAIIAGLDQTGLGDAGFVRPMVQNVIDVLIHYVFPIVKDREISKIIIPIGARNEQSRCPERFGVG